ncbi:MAG: hypothetical protein EKK40_13395 [Bradyrhizobiaceae bacterium]|nr:MAG: hypothetical protein EKK40_13395 [Bradyrhizobiaceae bacterium]
MKYGFPWTIKTQLQPAPGEVEDESRERVSGGLTLPEDSETGQQVWTSRLVIFLRSMAVLSMAMGLYNWAQITGFIGGEDGAFEVQTTQWQSATVYFAVIELVAAVGLWLATPWGAVVWLTTVVSMAVIELMFPTVYGGHLVIVIFALAMLAAYLGLAWMAARERPP